MANAYELLMTEPSAYEVSYAINPWMRPQHWAREPQKHQASLAWRQLYHGLKKAGARVYLMNGVGGLPDLVFPANAAIVLDGRALLSRFAFPQRQREESIFRDYFDLLLKRNVIAAVGSLPEGLYQEGAGDCLWDGHRECFWSAYGQRSLKAASNEIARFFQCEVRALELIDPYFYHLDVAMAILERGEVVYYPGAFSAASRKTIRQWVPASSRIEIGRPDAARFNLNIINLGEVIFTTATSDSLRGELSARGYRLCELDLSPFILAGGAAACLTLRLDYRRAGSGSACGGRRSNDIGRR